MSLEDLFTLTEHGGDVHVGNELGKLLNVTDKLAQERGDSYISSELFVLAALQGKGDIARILDVYKRGGRGDATAAQTDADSFAVMEPEAPEENDPGHLIMKLL